MRAVVIGSGDIGTAVKQVLVEHGHEVVTVGRQSGDLRADIGDVESLRRLFAEIGTFDAVANAAGHVRSGPVAEATDEQWADSIASKGMGQINVVRAALPHIADNGSFTLVSGVLADEFTHGSSISAA